MTLNNNRESAKETIKAVFTFMGMLIFLAVGTLYLHYYNTHYTMNAIVIGVENGKVLVEDDTNNLWEFEGEGFFLNDTIQTTFWTHNTDTTREDDEIIKVKKTLDNQ